MNDRTKLIRIIANLETREVTAWPTDAKGIRVGEPVVWQLYLDRNDPGTFPPDPARLERLKVPFALKFDPADGFKDVEVHGVGEGQTVAVKQGVYHYELAFTFENKVFAIFGCPSTEVRN